MVRPIKALSETKSYAIPPRPAYIDLPLGNTERLFMSPEEERALDQAWTESARSAAGHYPDARGLEAALAERIGVAAEQVIVTAGADEALERACKAVLEPGRTMLIPTPTFAMIPHYAKLTGAEVKTFPSESNQINWTRLREACDEKTAAIAVISPNNPTGSVLDVDAFIEFAEAFPDVLCIFDGAYAEFADVDPLTQLVKLPNVVVVRTMSKAWGLPGLRVGYAVASREVTDWMRATSGPYTVSHTSLKLAEACLQDGAERKVAFVENVRRERAAISEAMKACGFDVQPSEANFLFATVPDQRADYWESGLASLGIGVRRFGGDLSNAIRVSCPGTQEGLERVVNALETIDRPDALIFDMDGVMVDVAESYRAAIVETAKVFGIEVSREDIVARKARGNANNDWVVTRDLIEEAGGQATLEEVTETFEKLYQGTETVAGLRDKEKLVAPRAFYESLRDRFKLGIVTGRPRQDAEYLLRLHGLSDLFESVVCMEDAALKPSPEPVQLACRQLGTKRAWMFGDTPDDIRAARAAGVMPIGVIAPGESPERATAILQGIGAAKVITSIIDWEK